MSATNFRDEWTKEEIIEYLERKGEDYEDFLDHEELIQRAIACEVNAGKPAIKRPHAEHADGGADEEEDALDAFMRDIENVVDTDVKECKGERLYMEDPGVDFLEKTEECQSKEQVVADDGGGVSGSVFNIDHSKIEYERFEKTFCHDTAPIDDFKLAFDSHPMLLKAIERAGYKTPTTVQGRAIPMIMSGKDVLGIAETGSGKSAAFILPMMVHVMAQRPILRGEGPISLVVTPTRELAEQIHRECRRFSNHSLKVCAAWGGLHKYDQIKQFKIGVEIAICTPGRILDLIQSKCCTLRRVTYVVLDEADKMFDMGFEPQIKDLMKSIRPDRQTIMFSATMPTKIEKLANEMLRNPERIVVGPSMGGVNPNIAQHVHVTNTLEEKKAWLSKRLETLIDKGDVLIFCNKKQLVQDLFSWIEPLVGQGRSGILYGEMDQASRMDTLAQLKHGRMHVLIATDIASRGIHVETIKTVINFDAPSDISTYIHRIGRTSRGESQDGASFTLLYPNESKQAAFIVSCMSSVGMEAPKYVVSLANTFRKRKMFKHQGIVGKSVQHREHTPLDVEPQMKRKKTESDRFAGVAGFVGETTDIASQNISSVSIVPPKSNSFSHITPAPSQQNESIQLALRTAQQIANRLTGKESESKQMTKKRRWDRS